MLARRHRRGADRRRGQQRRRAGGVGSIGHDGLGDLPINPAWLANTLGHATNIGSVKNNSIDGAIARRDTAVAAMEGRPGRLQGRHGPQPDPLAKPEYNVVWSSKQNVADVHADVISKFVQASTVNPQGLPTCSTRSSCRASTASRSSTCARRTSTARRTPTTAKVVNFVQLPLPWGLENEAHHMQYEWEDGDPILAGGLYTGTTHVLDPSDIPNLKLLNEIPNTATPGGSIADAYEKGEDGRFYLTLMGGPLANFGGSPGEIVTFKPDADEGHGRRVRVARRRRAGRRPEARQEPRRHPGALLAARVAAARHVRQPARHRDPHRTSASA